MGIFDPPLPDIKTPEQEVTLQIDASLKGTAFTLLNAYLDVRNLI